MNEDDKKLQKRFSELAARAAARGCWTNTEFLTPAEQDLLLRTPLDAPAALCGGFDTAERKLALFGSQALCGYEAQPPITCLLIAPSAPKFAEELSHRDFLGALTGLGIRREVLGDIVLQDGAAYLFCLDSIADFILDSCTQIRRTAVRAARVDTLPELLTKIPDLSTVIAASARLDALVAAVWKLSRSEAKRLVEDGHVFVNSRLAQDPAAELDAGDLVSARGFGRFRFETASAETRKGRLRAEIRRY